MIYTTVISYTESLKKNAQFFKIHITFLRHIITGFVVKHSETLFLFLACCTWTWWYEACTMWLSLQQRKFSLMCDTDHRFFSKQTFLSHIPTWKSPVVDNPDILKDRLSTSSNLQIGRPTPRPVIVLGCASYCWKITAVSFSRSVTATCYLPQLTMRHSLLNGYHHTDSNKATVLLSLTVMCTQVWTCATSEKWKLCDLLKFHNKTHNYVSQIKLDLKTVIL